MYNTSNKKVQDNQCGVFLIFIWIKTILSYTFVCFRARGVYIVQTGLSAPFAFGWQTSVISSTRKFPMMSAIYSKQHKFSEG